MANVQKVQRLTFIEHRGQDKQFNYLALFRCECGNERVYPIKEVRNMRKTACGCRRAKEFNQHSVKHGLRGHPLYYVWLNMIKRCTDNKNIDWENYGGRGILICKEWYDITVFVKWAESNGYKPGLELDRKEVNGNYEPDNCRFVTSKENNNNRRNNRFLEFNGVKKTVSQWADAVNIPSSIIRSRIDRQKWDIEKSLTHPYFKNNQHRPA